MEQTITIDLTVSEVNTILATLGKQPFAEVAYLISKIKTQGDSQVEPAQPAESAEEA
jgi:hypothetical protein